MQRLIVYAMFIGVGWYKNNRADTLVNERLLGKNISFSATSG
ncbi:MAG TPA: hypothetical protein VII11_02085 [Bacteroidota bacterium]